MQPVTKQWIYAFLGIACALAGIFYLLLVLLLSSRPEKGIVLTFFLVFGVLFFFWEREKSRKAKSNS
jgi:H+/Cl- antiporter ClcA